MKRVLLVLFCLLAFPVVASHIVGGEFEIIHISGNLYRVNLILYFDERNGDQGAKDGSVVARIFRMRDNKVMMDVPLTLTKIEPVAYTQPECSNGEVVTSKITYSTTVTLADGSYNDPQGYYISWERCCRNYNITNIYSQDPQEGGIYAGQTFYLEFPPVVKNGQPFINSTPRLFPPLNDYACPRKPYYVDFGGVDDDGDSLVYSLVMPLNTKSADALPPGDLLPRPKPYPNVTFRSGYSLAGIMRGAPDLKISEDGFLTVTPTRQGLYVFAVKCEEYRDNIKIGEVRRDFQLLVVDACPVAEPPQIKGKKLADPAFTYDGNMNITFPNTTSDTERCIQVQVSDPDALRKEDGFQERIRIKAFPLGFKGTLPVIMPAETSAVLNNGSTHTFDICFQRCPLVEGRAYRVGIIAYDDACSLPLTDTLKVTVMVEPPANTGPILTPDVVAQQNFDEVQHWDIEAVDPDGDEIRIDVVPAGFDLASAGMSISVLSHVNGLYKARLTWDTDCHKYSFSRKMDFELKIIAEDRDVCNFPKPDEMNFDLKFIPPLDADPVITSDLPAHELQNGISRKIFETIAFNVTGTDADHYPIRLVANGVDFNIDDYNITFPEVTGNGIPGITSLFEWKLTCDKFNLAEKSEYSLDFIVVDDQNYCFIYKADTLNVKVKVNPPDNIQPILRVASTNPQLLFKNNEQDLKVGQQIALALTAKDEDKVPAPDAIVIDLVTAEGNVEPAGYEFVPAEGVGSAQTTFIWNTDCAIFEDRVWKNNYTFTFCTYDKRCFNAKSDTVVVNFTIEDIDAEVEAFIPPNFISPNGDGINDFFAMVKEDGETLELESILPKDNCAGQFVGIYIFNRWGSKIYESNNRDFRWQPHNEAMGVYYYTLRYTDKDFKGSITLRD